MISRITAWTILRRIGTVITLLVGEPAAEGEVLTVSRRTMYNLNR
jgi:hypothetical protein